MARRITEEEKSYLIGLLVAKDPSGNYKYGQRQLEREIDVSRPYLRKLAKIVGRTFNRNGIEVVGQLCMCVNCGGLFRRSRSKIENKKRIFCDEMCKNDYMRGKEHANWKDGKTAKSWSSWVYNQSEYETFRKKVLERDGYKCQISGDTQDLQVHHLEPKQEGIAPEKTFDPNNGITISRKVHNRIHQLISQGYGFEEAVEMVKKEYKKGNENE